MKGDVVTNAGIGTVLNMSTKGIAFTSDATFHAGMSVTLSISWPVLLDGQTRIMLVVDGKVVRREGHVTAVQIVRHAFHTKKSD